MALFHIKMVAEKRKTTMGHITQDHLKQSRRSIPPLDLIRTIDGLVNPFFEKHLILEKQNQHLTQLRD